MPAHHKTHARHHKHRLTLPLLPLLLAFLSIVSVLFLLRLTTDHRLLTTDFPVPEPVDKPRDTKIAVPVAVFDYFPGSFNKYRTFSLKVEKDRLSHDKILVYQNDIVRLQIQAADKTFILTIPTLGIRQEIAAQETKTAEFQTTTLGSFPLLCENCPDPDKPLGALIVKSISLPK